MDPAFEVTETRIETSDTKAIKKEAPMTSSNETPPGGFPKSIHGYNVGAVDDYVRKLNGRLESLLSQVQSESSRADQSKRLLEQATSELETMRRRSSDAEKREIVALEGQKRAQEESGRLAQELKEAREKARAELESALAAVRQERDELVAEERREAEALIAEARRSAVAQIEEAHQLAASLRQEVARLQAELSAPQFHEVSGDHTDTQDTDSGETTEAQSRRLEAEIEEQRVYARTQIDLVVEEARRNAEEASERTIAVFHEQERRVQALGDECEALAARMKEAIEAQIVQTPGAPLRAGASRSALRNDEPEEKRIRDNREWRTGDWRNAS